jgi:hypothetical protein
MSIEVNGYKTEHGPQLRAHSCSVRLMSTTHFQLLRMLAHVFSCGDTSLQAYDPSKFTGIKPVQNSSIIYCGTIFANRILSATFIILLR